MGEVVYRGNLSASTWAMVSTFQGRTVIVPGPDQNYVRGLQASEGGLVDDASRGVPQILYGHNIMPSDEGFQSVGFNQRVAGAALGALLDTVLAAREIPAYFMYDASAGGAYVLKNIGGAWFWNAATIGAPALDLFGTISMTCAMVQGVTYFLLNNNIFAPPGAPCRTLDAFDNFNAAPLVGVPFVGRIRGNASCFGYHILYNETAIAWSSTLNPLDFTPSLVTGAGTAQVEGLRGVIVSVIPHQLGLIVYSTANAVAAIYTGNARYPFQFKEITGVGGFPDIQPSTWGNADSFISDDSNTNSHYAYTSSGLQKINTNQIELNMPDVTDFISGNVFEDFDVATRLFTRSILTSQMFKKLNVIADRYLVISYGTTINLFTHALIYDLVNKRFGKIRLAHITAFTLQNTAALSGATTINSTGPRGSIAFMQRSGVIYTIDFTPNLAVTDSVIILGKFQYTRQNMLQLQRIDMENIELGGTASLFVYTSLDGKNPRDGVDTAVPPVAANLNVSATNVRTWRFHRTGLNHSLCLVGSFYLSTLVMEFNKAGKR